MSMQHQINPRIIYELDYSTKFLYKMATKVRPGVAVGYAAGSVNISIVSEITY
jgi:hypothetical protein